MTNTTLMVDRLPIRSAMLREHFLCDYVDELADDLLDNNIRSFEKVINNPDKFPNANVEWLDELVLEMKLLRLSAYGY